MFAKGYTPWNKGKTGIKTSSKGYKHTEKARKSMSMTRKRLGIKPPSALGLKRSEETKRKQSESLKKAYSDPELRRRTSERQLGSKSHRWKGGKLPELVRIRNGVEIKLWREAVYKRDKWTCVFCGSIGGRLNADHIKPFASYPELRFAIDNGRTLCVPCHRKTDTYGGRTRRT